MNRGYRAINGAIDDKDDTMSDKIDKTMKNVADSLAISGLTPSDNAVYYEVVQVNWEFDGKHGYIYTGMRDSVEDGLLERAKECFPQYNNLRVIEHEGELKTEIMEGWIF